MRENTNQFDNERGLLASIMASDDNSIYDSAITLGISEDCFLTPIHRKIFEAMKTLSTKNRPLDEVEVASILQSEEGICEKVNDIRASVETSLHWKTYAIFLRNEEQRREIKRAYELFAENPDNLEHGENLAKLETAIMQVNRRISDFPDTDQILNESLEDLKRRIRDRGDIGIRTGFSVLDSLHIQKGNLAVLGGRPATGKTALMLNIVANILKQDKPTPMLIFSLEMTREELVSRLISLISGVSASGLRNGVILATDKAKIENAYAFLRGKSKLFHIIDKAGMNYLQMLSYARKYKHKYGIGLIFVDYLQLIKPVSKKSIREQEVAEVSRSLKEIAKDLECSVIALVQLNRETEKENRPPRASDIRESGSIEQDADYIIMLSRVVKGTRTIAGREEKITTYNIPDSASISKPIIKVHIVKNRHGSVGEDDFIFNKELTKFEIYN